MRTLFRSGVLAVSACVALGIPPLTAQAAAGARPKVGLVLGGGGARGGAHLGVLEVLEELRVPFDCVAGTSMGALMGGVFLSGVSTAGMRKAIGNTDWDSLFDDGAGREYVNLRRKAIDDRFFSSLEFGVTKDGLAYREGAVAGEKIKLFFNELVRADLGERNIEELPLPATLIATDIGTGERVAMRSGSLTTAMRASMSVPGALAPVMRDGRKLVDGGLVDNVPVREVRERCGAEVVIAVNVGSPLFRPEEVTGIVSVVGQMVNLLAEQNVAQSLASLGPNDIYLRPELGKITAASFERQLEAADIGRQAALGIRERLAALSVSAADYASWQSRLRHGRNPAPPVIDEIQLADTRFVNKAELRDNIRQQAGTTLDAARLAEDLVLIYSRGDLQNLDYAVLRERDRTVLRITPIENSWGPDYLRFGLNFSSNLDAESDYNLRALYRRTWLNANGAEWLVTAQLGSQQLLATEFYQPLDYRQRWFVQPYLDTASRKFSLYFDGARIADYRTRESRGGVDIGANLGRAGQVKAGWIERHQAADLMTGLPVLPNSQRTVGGIRAQLTVDTYDQAFFPSRGYRADLNYFDAIRHGKEASAYSLAEGRVGGAWSAGPTTALVALSAGKSLRGTLPLGDAFTLGGQGRLSAFAPGQIIGGDYALATLQAQYRLNKPVPLLGLQALVGVTVERARMRDSITEPNLTGNIDSLGVYLAMNTPLGPIYLGFADSRGRKSRVYFFLGSP